MESQHQKWVSLSYLVAAALVAFIVFTLSTKIAGTWDLEARVRNIDLMIRIGSLVLGGVLFVGFSRYERGNQFMHEVVTELARVTWPTQKETASATVVVVVMVLISSIVLGFLDYLWTRLLQWVL